MYEILLCNVTNCIYYVNRQVRKKIEESVNHGNSSYHISDSI